jgi:hypothetical protein
MGTGDLLEVGGTYFIFMPSPKTFHSPLSATPAMLKKITMLAATMLASSGAYAAHPLITDDTGTQGTGKFQIEITGEFSSDEENVPGTTIKETGGEIAAALSYGISENIDLVVGMPYQWYAVKESGVKVADGDGIGDMSVELKWRFLDTGEEGTSLALKPGISIPAGSEKEGFGTGAVSGGVMLIATHTGKPGTLHANLGYSRVGYGTEENDEVSRNDIWHASLAGELNMTETLRAVADIGIGTNGDKSSDTHPAYLIGGVICSLNDDMEIDLGVKCGLNDAETDTAFLAGYTARF